MKTKILRNIFITVGVLFTLPRLLGAGTSDSTDPGQGTQPQARQISVAPLLIGGSQCYAQPVGARIALSEMARAKAAGRFLWQPAANVQVPLAMGDVITFDVPGAVNTQPSSINSAGIIVGYYFDANFLFHGFLRAPDGSFTTFDVPGDVFGTFGSGINSAGVITGTYCDAITCHGFLRAPDGSFTTFDPPGSLVTQPVGINEGGAVTGGYVDAAFNFHSFVRAADGTFDTFDPGFVQNLSGIINPAGAIVGYFFSGAAPPIRSFVRDPKGVITVFDAPSVCQTGNGTFAQGINPAGVIVGTYVDAACSHFHGFLRSRDGTLTTIDVPGASDTDPNAINPSGTVTGIVDGIGFLRTPDGTFTRFDVPGAVNGGLVPSAINAPRAVTGYWFEANGATHGFLFQPR
jgi:predicted membrane protein